MFGKGNFFLEIQDHQLDDDKIVMPLVYQLSRDTGIPLVATNDAHYLRKDDARMHELMLCIQTGKTLSDTNRMRFTTEEFHVKSLAEMRQIFSDIPDALSRTWDIAQRCHIKLDKVKDPFPRFEVPPEQTIDTHFEYVAREGFESRRMRLEALHAQGLLKHALPEYEERLDFEIKMIQQMKFSGYFLVVWDFIRYAREHNIPVGPGRGSAAGSLVGYAMRITDIDPLQYGLLFERFLNPERVSMPDIDIDFCTRRRGEVIQYVTQKYGREQVAQIITFGTLGARQAIKDVGRVLDMKMSDVERITKLVPNQLNIKLKEAFKIEPGFDEMRKKDPRVAEVLDVACKLEGMARNCSIHAAGVVISPTPLRELVPLYKTNKDEVVTQYDMNGMDKLNLLKMDFLGLTTLTIMADAKALIHQFQNIDVDLDQLPLDDPKAYEIFTKGFTSGIFQFESAGMRDILIRYKPERVEDLCALNALYRPGPIQGGVVDDFIDRKHGRKRVSYDLPELKPILEETYGIILYQEQVMQVANRIAGYSLGEADILRRAMGKKKAEEMAKQRERFVVGALANNHPQAKVEKLFDLMEQFAAYGFNKSHSAAYAYVAYITAYLKAHFPLEFLSALLTSETGNTAKVVKYINECRDMGIKVLPPDVNKPGKTFTPDGDAVRFGLCAIKNVGEAAVDSIIAARKTGGPFKSIFNFCERVDLSAVNRRMIESLIRAGAFDSFGAFRSQLYAVIDSAMESGARTQRDRLSGQAGLFNMTILHEDEPEPALPTLPDWPDAEKLTGEKEMLGFYVTGHPLDAYRDKVTELATFHTGNLENLEKGDEVIICGVMTGIQRRRNKEQKPWAAFQIEDWYGSAEAMLFTTQYERLMNELVEDRAVKIRAQALPEEGSATKLSVQDITPLDVARVDLASLIGIRLRLTPEVEAKVGELRDLFIRKPGNAEVRLRLERPKDFSVILDVANRVRPDKEFKASVAQLFGSEAYEELAK